MIRLRDFLGLRPWSRHGMVLMVGGLVYILVGISFLTRGELTPRQLGSLVVALRMASMNVWALVFIFSGALACLSSRWPKFSDGWGYAILCGLSTAWSSTYFMGIVFGGASPRVNIPIGLVWGLMAFIWWAISGLLNPTPLLEVIDESY